MELRWVKKPATAEWPLSFHLQYMKNPISSEWFDTPILTEEPIKKDYDLDDHIGDTNKMVEPKGSGEWCEHCMTSRNEMTTFKMVEGYIGWNFCPICGTPRPKEIGLREKLVEQIYKYFDEKPIHPLSKDMDMVALADIAIRTIKEHEGEL